MQLFSAKTNLLTVLVAGLLWISLPSSGAADTNSYLKQDTIELEQKREDDAQLLEGLRRRRLFDLAQLHCQRRLSQPTVDATTETRLTIELMKIRIAKAILTPKPSMIRQRNSPPTPLIIPGGCLLKCNVG